MRRWSGWTVVMVGAWLSERPISSPRVAALVRDCQSALTAQQNHSTGKVVLAGE